MRYAVYYTPPPDHPLWRVGCEWLGRDLAGDVMPPARDHVAEPRRYGFHATLKPPMQLAAGHDDSSLKDAVTALARRTSRFEMPALAVRPMGRFIALRPVDEPTASHPLRRLADACVTELEAWRAPLTEAQLQRRLAAPLTPEQRDMLARYGYQHVLALWRFHMTLSDSLADASAREGLQRAAQSHFAEALAQPLTCDALSLFAEPGDGRPFTLLQRYPLA
jgi:hypothetical protein